jgi:predicted esterase YcpF (UPF0227 family)
MSKKVIVYFHGYGSSAKSDKVARLAKFGEAHAFDIHIDPSVSIPELGDKIDMLLAEDVNAEDEVIFVGTSLGGWYASVMAKQYDCKAIVINPCYDPVTSLIKYGVAESVLVKYFKMPILDKAEYIFAEVDEVIDHSKLRIILASKSIPYIIVSNSDHRFNGPEFEATLVKVGL